VVVVETKETVGFDLLMCAHVELRVLNFLHSRGQNPTSDTNSKKEDPNELQQVKLRITRLLSFYADSWQHDRQRQPTLRQ